MSKKKNNVLRVVRLLFRLEPRLFLCMLANSLAGFGTLYIGIFLPEYLIDGVMRGKTVKWLILGILAALILRFLFSEIKYKAEYKHNIYVRQVSNKVERTISEKCMTLDFEKIEEPKTMELKEKAAFPIYNQNVVMRVCESFLLILEALWTVLGTIPLMIRANIAIIPILMLFTALNMVLSRRIRSVLDERYKQIIPINRKLEYYDNVSQNFTYAKDIRLYRQDIILTKKYKEYLSSMESLLTSFEKKGSKYWCLISASSTMQMVSGFAIYVYETIRGRISIGALSTCLSASSNFCMAFDDLINNSVLVKQYTGYLDYYFEFEELESQRKNEGKGIQTSREYTVDFVHVSFKYPGTDKQVLKDITLRIHPHEKLAVVGMNSAGKTTMIKLLLRLYEPTAGEILLNGTNIQDYSYEEYIQLLAVVFQDFKMFAIPLCENIAFSGDYNEQKIMKAIEDVGMQSAVEQLPDKIHALIYKIFDDKGIEFSGGQYQKLAIARAIYKGSPIMILDEPTAALDPQSEFEIYSNFNSLVGNRTTIYISHRLSSCKFCEKIAVLDCGALLEYGSHSELMSMENGKYRELFEAQARYYKQ